jgi:hypothetical protein
VKNNALDSLKEMKLCNSKNPVYPGLLELKRKEKRGERNLLLTLTFFCKINSNLQGCLSWHTTQRISLINNKNQFEIDFID